MVRSAEALLPSLVAVMRIVPTVTPPTSPLPLTVGTDALLVVQVTPRPVNTLPASPLMVAVNCTSCPTGTHAVAGLITTAATGNSARQAEAASARPNAECLIRPRGLDVRANSCEATPAMPMPTANDRAVARAQHTMASPRRARTPPRGIVPAAKPTGTWRRGHCGSLSSADAAARRHPCSRAGPAGHHGRPGPVCRTDADRRPPTIERDLVFDIGVNNRDDTAHCLRRGSRVVGFDADYLIELAGLRVCEKHSVGSLTTSRSRPATLRRVVYKGMSHLLPVEPRGTTG